MSFIKTADAEDLYKDHCGWKRCPYDRNHVVKSPRFPAHIIRCSERNAYWANGKMLVCPFNETHHVNESYIDEHITRCADRIRMGYNKHCPGYCPLVDEYARCRRKITLAPEPECRTCEAFRREDECSRNPSSRMFGKDLVLPIATNYGVEGHTFEHLQVEFQDVNLNKPWQKTNLADVPEPPKVYGKTKAEEESERLAERFEQLLREGDSSDLYAYPNFAESWQNTSSPTKEKDNSTDSTSRQSSIAQDEFSQTWVLKYNSPNVSIDSSVKNAIEGKPESSHSNDEYSFPCALKVDVARRNDNQEKHADDFTIDGGKDSTIDSHHCYNDGFYVDEWDNNISVDELDNNIRVDEWDNNITSGDSHDSHADDFASDRDDHNPIPDRPKGFDLDFYSEIFMDAESEFNDFKDGSFEETFRFKAISFLNSIDEEMITNAEKQAQIKKPPIVIPPYGISYDDVQLPVGRAACISYLDDIRERKLVMGRGQLMGLNL